MALTNLPQSPAWAKQKENLFVNWERMRQNGLLTDLTIVCGEEEFKVHSTYVCAAIPFFNQMYKGSHEPLKDIVELKSVKPAAMSIVLDFIYTGIVFKYDDDDLKGYGDILHATHLLQIEPLFEEYYRSLAGLITVNYFAKLLDIAEVYGGNGFATMITFLAENFFHITTTDDYLALNVCQLKEVLNHPRLKEENAAPVVQAILSWVKLEDERHEHLDSLFSFVDLDKLSVAYLQELTHDSTLVKNNQIVYSKVVAAVLGKLQVVPNDEKQLMCFGSINGVSVSSKYCLETRKWSTLKTLDFNFQFGMTVAKYLELYYFIGGGGCEEGYVPSTAIYKYDPNTNKSARLNDLVVPVNQAGVGVLGGFLYVVGGRSEDNFLISAVQCVNPSNGSTTLVAQTNQVHNAPSVFPFRGYLYTVGSGIENWSCVERYDPAADKWSVATVVPEAINWCQTTLWKNKLVVLCNNYDKKLHLYDMDSECWETRNFVGAPTGGIWGLWTACLKSCEMPFLLIREASGMLHGFNVDHGFWMGALGSTGSPANFPLCLMC